MITNNVSSIQTHQTMMNVNANNVANVNTDGFVPSSGAATESAQGSVSPTLSQATDNGSLQSQTSLSKELTDQVVIEDAVEANVTAIKTQEEMYGTLLDIKV